MIGVLRKHPGILLLTVICVLGAGVVLAHRSGSVKIPKTALSSHRPSAKAHNLNRLTQLDLSRARPQGGRLQQRLEDGTTLTYTLVPELQTKMSAYFQRNEVPYAAAVAYRVDNGELLLMVGTSARDKKLDSAQLCLKPWAPAASIFKLVTVAGLLNQGVPSTTSVCYHGGFRGLRAQHLEDNPRLDTTCRTLSDALAKSINPIVGKLALRYLNRGSMLSWAERFGFNKSVPFELPVEPSRAQIPSNKVERARTAAGFWHTELSVLHGAALAGVPATGGLLAWPHLVRSMKTPDGKTITPPKPDRRRVMGRRAARDLAQMMARTTTMGTGRRGFISRRGKPFLGDMRVAGKTGSLSRKKPFLHYSWFVGFAPADKPEIAFAVLLGNPARWRIKASTAARVLLQSYVAHKAKTRKIRSRKQSPRG
ncbi:MAG: penicillin-binding protein [Deltaproteobacteria bacterium]|nr:penicillin-binding protein [Deltaproteobacteria bacterium]